MESTQIVSYLTTKVTAAKLQSKLDLCTSNHLSWGYGELQGHRPYMEDRTLCSVDFAKTKRRKSSASLLSNAVSNSAQQPSATKPYPIETNDSKNQISAEEKGKFIAAELLNSEATCPEPTLCQIDQGGASFSPHSPQHVPHCDITNMDSEECRSYIFQSTRAKSTGNALLAPLEFALRDAEEKIASTDEAETAVAIELEKFIRTLSDIEKKDGDGENLLEGGGEGEGDPTKRPNNNNNNSHNNNKSTGSNQSQSQNGKKGEESPSSGNSSGSSSPSSGSTNNLRANDKSPTPEVVLDSSHRLSLFGVFDGHGGSLASEYIKQNILEYIKKSSYFPKSLPDAMADALLQCDQKFLQEHPTSAKEDGSTVLFGILHEYPVHPSPIPDCKKPWKRTLYVANAGDSRAVLCEGGKAIALSEDHKPNRVDERSRIEASGGVVDRAFFWGHHIGPYRVYTKEFQGGLAVSRGFGDGFLKSKHLVICQPDIIAVDLTPDSQFIILATDGVWDVLENQDAVDLVIKLRQEGLAAVKAASNIVMKAFEKGSMDNISAVVVYFSKPVQPDAAAHAETK